MIEIREAAFGNDVIEVADLVLSHCNEKSTAHVCRSRVYECVKKSIRTGLHSFALVAHKDGKLVGFCYAEERPAFGLWVNVEMMEVHFLVGGSGSGLPLLRHLRANTKKRILVPSWSLLGNMKSLNRLLRPLTPQLMAELYQI